MLEILLTVRAYWNLISRRSETAVSTREAELPDAKLPRASDSNLFSRKRFPPLTLKIITVFHTDRVVSLCFKERRNTRECERNHVKILNNLSRKRACKMKNTYLIKLVRPAIGVLFYNPVSEINGSQIF